jgi:hypothetical protein
MKVAVRYIPAISLVLSLPSRSEALGLVLNVDLGSCRHVLF